ncbi:MAG: DUF5668 domain-containing protein [Candidatus Micrarchaeota archaeon]|nr:DUF5668 domain-containing protein [Candidatus Micrarchaeota archaeon]
MFDLVRKSSLFHLALGLTLVVFGLLFLLSNYGVIPSVEWGKIWPIVLIILGLAFLIKGQMPQERTNNWL